MRFHTLKFFAAMPDQLFHTDKICALTGLSETRLKVLAREGVFPKPVKGEYQLTATIAGLLKYYRERLEKSDLQDTYDTIHSCSAATLIPVGIIRLAKKSGCAAFKNSRVTLLPLLHWIFSQKDADDKVDWTAEVRKWQAKRERLKHERESDHLIERSQVVETIHRIIPRVTQVLEAKLLNEWPSAVAGLDPAQARVYGKRLLDQTFAGLVQRSLKTLHLLSDLFFVQFLTHD